MTNCGQVLERLSEYLDEELPPGSCEDIARHLSECSDCNEAKQEMLRSIELCRHFHSDETPGELPAEVREQLRAAYRKVRSAMNQERR